LTVAERHISSSNLQRKLFSICANANSNVKLSSYHIFTLLSSWLGRSELLPNFYTSVHHFKALKYRSDDSNDRPQADVAEAEDPSTAKHVPRGKNRNLTDNLTEAVPQDVVKAVPPIGGLGNAVNGVTEDRNQPAKAKEEDKKESLRIHIELDLDVELHLTARVKGDVTIGLL